MTGRGSTTTTTTWSSVITSTLISLAMTVTLVTPVVAATTDCFDGTSPFFDVDEWTYCQKINDELFMYYNPFQEENKGNLLLGLHAPNHLDGWSSLAIGGNGGMKGASQIVIRKDADNEWIAEDRHSLDYVTPSLDESQDVQLLFAQQNDNSGTSWGVRIKMNSCDEHDYAIEDLDRFMLWALGTSREFLYHGSNNRGQFHANLMQAPSVEQAVDDLEFIDFSMNSVNVVAAEGQDPSNPYICSVFDLNVLKEGFDADQDKMHAVRFSPNLDPATSQYVHHMILYACDSEGATRFSNGEVIPDCESMPVGCSNTKWQWALGSEDIVLPENVGMPFGEGERVLILQTHYYLPNLDTGLVDSSGVRTYLAPQPRSIDADYFRIASAVNPLTEPGTIPPGTTFTLPSMYVPSDCTNTWEEPLNVMFVGYHQHLIGVHIQLDLYRNGENMGPMRIQHRYDFAHQSMEPTRIQQVYPGDEFRLTCTYDSSSRTEPTAFGERSEDEMCLAGFMYYPRQQNSLTANLPIAANMDLCTVPGTGNHADVSACAQGFLENVPRFFGIEDMLPLPIGGVTLCNSDILPSEGTGFMPGLELCPPCGEDRSCTEDTVKAWAQDHICPFWCGTAGLSVYPNTTSTETNVNRRLICGTTPMTAVDIEMPAPVCVPMGDLDVETDSTLDDNIKGDLDDDETSGATTVVLSTIVVSIAAMILAV